MVWRSTAPSVFCQVLFSPCLSFPILPEIDRSVDRLGSNPFEDLASISEASEQSLSPKTPDWYR
jgi:hypothetical protein